MQSRFARYGPTDHYDGPPQAGFCVSVFAVVRKRGDTKFLAGIPRDSQKWQNEWLHSKTPSPELFEQWRLPSCYLKEGEHPEEALARAIKGQLGATDFKIGGPPKVVSSYSPSDWYPGRMHWDLAFVFDVELASAPPQSTTSKWWREIGFFRRGREFGDRDFGWNNDLIRDLGLS